MTDDSVDIGTLISRITPLYNAYAHNRNMISGTDALRIMWDIGDILKNQIDGHKIAPHKLYRMIYGKSEGATNIVQLSYIPREFQSRCYRIRNMFSSKVEIGREFPKLKSFTLFREAMPFLDNKLYRLEGQDRDRLVSLLNSDKSYASIREEIRKLQKVRIGRSNPRTQRLADLTHTKEAFLEAYRWVYRLVHLDSYEAVVEQVPGLKTEKLRRLSGVVGALVSEGLKVPDRTLLDRQVGPLSDLVDIANELFSAKHARVRNRFRRLVSPERISELANMLYAISSRDAFRSFHRETLC